MSARGRILAAALAAAGWLVLAAAPAWALNVQQLSPPEIEQLHRILEQLEPVIGPKKLDGTAVLLTWDQLYAPLALEDRAFLDGFRALKASELGATSHYFGEPADQAALMPLGHQEVRKAGAPVQLDPQFLPKPVHEAYQRMMQAMEQALGRRLLVESGYRSPAYQLYLFLFYLPKHDYSITETNRFVALPGHSEHGYPPRQAIDFINQDGINGEDQPETFEALPEYGWLQAHAGAYGFALSYPRNNALNTAFEPWHWHYEPR